MKSLRIDVVMSWEYGLIIFLVGLFLVIYGVRQDKKKEDDFTKVPITKPTTKIMFGTIIIIFGAIQMLLKPSQCITVQLGASRCISVHHGANRNSIKQ